MGTPLTGSSVASTYTGLLKVGDNSTLTTTLKSLSDGSGVDSSLQVSTTGVKSTGTMDVTGATSLSTLATSGAATIGGALNVTGATTLTGNLSVPGTLGVTGATSLSTLATSGAATLASLGVTGAATVGTTLGVTGATPLARVGVTGAATVGTTLGVTGATTLASVGVTGAATVGTTLDVTGAATLSNNLTVTGNATVNGDTTIGNANTDLLTINANVVTLPNLTNVTVDLANDKVLITDANDSSKLRSIAASALTPQCVQTLYKDSTAAASPFVATSTGSGTEITVLTTSITPRSTSSNILVSIVVNFSADSNQLHGAFRITRNGVEIGSNNIGSSLYGIAQISGFSTFTYQSTLVNQSIQILDSPSSASAVTYKIHLYATGSTFPQVWINRTYRDVLNNINSSFDPRVSSSMTLQEYFA